MTAEDLADLLLDAYDRAKPLAWIPLADDTPESRCAPRVRQRWLAVARDVRERLESSKRATMAATVMAALIAKGRGINGLSEREATAREALCLAGVLGAELAKPTASEASEIRLLREALSCVVNEGWVDVERCEAKMAPDVYAAMRRATA